MMRYGIPNFHMSHDVMDKEMNVVWRLGAELQCDARLGADFTLQDLLEKEGFGRRAAGHRRVRGQ